MSPNPGIHYILTNSCDHHPAPSLDQLNSTLYCYFENPEIQVFSLIGPQFAKFVAYTEF